MSESDLICVDVASCKAPSCNKKGFGGASLDRGSFIGEVKSREHFQALDHSCFGSDRHEFIEKQNNLFFVSQANSEV